MQPERRPLSSPFTRDLHPGEDLERKLLALVLEGTWQQPAFETAR
jgi:hypothetical protein